jgi:hypothetical protein
MGDVIIKGTKALVPFLRRFIDLHAEKDEAWRTVKRWRKKYGLPIEYAPNDMPYMKENRFYTWWEKNKSNVPRRSTGDLN